MINANWEGHGEKKLNMFYSEKTQIQTLIYETCNKEPNTIKLYRGQQQIKKKLEQLFSVILVGCFGSLSLSSIRAMISKCVEEEEQGNFCLYHFRKISLLVCVFHTRCISQCHSCFYVKVFKLLYYNILIAFSEFYTCGTQVL